MCPAHFIESISLLFAHACLFLYLPISTVTSGQSISLIGVALITNRLSGDPSQVQLGSGNLEAQLFLDKTFQHSSYHNADTHQVCLPSQMSVEIQECNCKHLLSWVTKLAEHKSQQMYSCLALVPGSGFSKFVAHAPTALLISPPKIHFVRLPLQVKLMSGNIHNSLSLSSVP